MSDQSKPAKSGLMAALGEGADLLVIVCAAILAILTVRVLLFDPFIIPSASMEPNLYEGDYIVVSKFSYGYSRASIPLSPPIFSGRILGRAPERGDIVVFKLPRDGRTDYVKRLIGLPGDRVQVKQGVVFINGAAVKRGAAPTGQEDMGGGVFGPVRRYRETLANGRTWLTNSFGPDGPADNTGVYQVPPHCYFMLGDNRDDSLDSRFDPAMPATMTGSRTCGWNAALDAYVPNDAGVGFVPEEDLVGRARIIAFSWKPGAALYKPWTWVSDARSDRFFKVLQ